MYASDRIEQSFYDILEADAQQSSVVQLTPASNTLGIPVNVLNIVKIDELTHSGAQTRLVL